MEEIQGTPGSSGDGESESLIDTVTEAIEDATEELRAEYRNTILYLKVMITLAVVIQLLELIS